jgi:hypothetical protein
VFSFQRHSIYHCSRGIAILEFALIAPLLFVLGFVTIDFGRLVNTRLVVTSVSREGGSLASRYRDIEIEEQREDIFELLGQSAIPLDIYRDGRIYISKITAGTSLEQPDPEIFQVHRGNLDVGSSYGYGRHNLGLPQYLYDRLVLDEDGSDIYELTVVEVFYKYSPITPLAALAENILLPDDGGIIIGSNSFF